MLLWNAVHLLLQALESCRVQSRILKPSNLSLFTVSLGNASTGHLLSEFCPWAVGA